MVRRKGAGQYYLLLPDLASRTRFIATLKEQGIQSVFHDVPLHSAPMGLKCGRARGELRTTADVSERLVRLPLWVGLEEGRVIEAAIEAVSRAG